MHRKRSFQKVRRVRQLLPTILTLISWTALVHICTTLSDFVRKELKAKLNLSERFQPDGVFRFENRASVYFDTAIY